ncbi:MAG TPA: thioredoxin domain-containing protein [Gammaproteobacteria bacterium]|nr:thioredoxin domain-containing protein [Gammaproteobacteria bacterium]
MKTDNKNLAVAIVIATLLVAAALVFLGKQLANRPDEARVIALIEERLGQHGTASDEAFNARVEQGIVAFIDKQQRAQAARPNQLAKGVPPPTTDDHVYGSPNAPVTLIEYSDFECPFCKRFHTTAKQLVDSSNGQVNWVYRHFPLASHNPGAQKQAEAAECAAALGGNDAFWRYTDAIYERTRSGGKGFPLANLTPLAVEIGLDKVKFQTCVDSGRFAQKVQQQMAAGERAGISGTPGNILYHRASGEAIALHGAQPLERFQQAVQVLTSQSSEARR